MALLYNLSTLVFLMRANLREWENFLFANSQPILYKCTYSKALRCTFFGERKKPCSSNFVQLLLLNRVKAKWSENRAAQGFHYINSFISNFFGPNSKTCTCEVRAAWRRVSRGFTCRMQYLFLQSIGYSRILQLIQLGLNTTTNCLIVKGVVDKKNGNI